jgi:hypothetical protein
MSPARFNLARKAVAAILIAAVVLPHPVGACCRRVEVSAPKATCCKGTNESTAHRESSSCCASHADCGCKCCRANDSAAIVLNRSPAAGHDELMAAVSDSVAYQPAIEVLRRQGGDDAAAVDRVELPHRILHCSWII